MFNIVPLFIFLICGLLAGCVDDKSKEIVLGENIAPLSGIPMIAQEKGFFKEEGLEVKVVPFTSGKVALEQLLADKLDMVTVAETPLVVAALQKQDFKILGTIFYSENACKIVGRSDLGIKTPQDLRKGKVATFFGTNAEFFLDQYLMDTTVNINPKTINKINLTPSDMVGALANGDISAFAVWEPFITKAKTMLGDKATILEKPGLYMTTFNLAVNNSFYKNHSTEEALAFFRALVKAEHYIETEKDSSIAIVSKHTGIPTAELERIWPVFQFKVRFDPSKLKGYMEEQKKWVLDNSTFQAKLSMDSTRNFDDFLDPRFIRKIDERRVGQ